MVEYVPPSLLVMGSIPTVEMLCVLKQDTLISKSAGYLPSKW